MNKPGTAFFVHASILAACAGLILPSIPARCLAAEERSEEKEIAALVAELNHPHFHRREAAEAKLVELGMAALPQLQEVMKNGNAETRYRAEYLLAVIREKNWSARLAAFVEDVGGQQQLSFPGWRAYRKIAGDSRASREFFVFMQRTERAVLQAYEEKYLSEIFLEECLERAEVIRSPNFAGSQAFAPLWGGGSPERRSRFSERDWRRRWKGSFGSLATLLLVVGDPSVDVPSEFDVAIHEILRQESVAAAISERGDAPLLRALVASWFDCLLAREPSERMFGSPQDIMTFVTQYRLKKGLGPVVKLFHSQNVSWQCRLEALVAVGLMRDASSAREMEDFLDNSKRFSKRMVDGRDIEIQFRDLALAVMLHCTGQDLSSYGFAAPVRAANGFYVLPTLYFPSPEQREQALARWRAWSKAHPVEDSAPGKTP